jgi:hypothetical protein
VISTDPSGKTAVTLNSPPRARTTCRSVLRSMSSRRSRRETFDWAIESRWASSEGNAIRQPLDSICRNDRSASPEQVVSLPRNGWPTFVGEVLEANQVALRIRALPGSTTEKAPATRSPWFVTKAPNSRAFVFGEAPAMRRSTTPWWACPCR